MFECYIALHGGLLVMSSFYRLITSYMMGGANCEAAKECGGHGKQISYRTLIVVHSTMHLIHPSFSFITL